MAKIETAESRAVKIAAKVMQAAGLCRYDRPDKCRKIYVDEATCDRCIEKWLLAKARKELKTHPEAQPNELQGDGWVSVKNPPDLGGGRYLVWTDNSGPEICRWSEARKRWIGGAWTQHITHWRPMPKPPKESA